MVVKAHCKAASFNSDLKIYQIESFFHKWKKRRCRYLKYNDEILNICLEEK